MQHPDITHTLLTGYPDGDGGAGFFCDRCKAEIMLGDNCLDHGGEFVCERCMKRLVRVAGGGLT